MPSNPRRLKPQLKRALTAGIPALALALAAALGLRLASAAPLAQAIECSWDRLASGELAAQHSLVGLPGGMAIGFGGLDPTGKPTFEAVTDTLSLLDLNDATGGGRGTWRRLTAEGDAPGARAQHASVLRAPAGQPASMITFGGVDRLPPGGTFTWQSPLTAWARPAQEPQRTVLDSSLALSLNPPRWQAIGGSGGGPRADHSAVYDPVDDAMIVFGGREAEEDGSRTADLRRLKLGDSGGDWELLNLDPAPEPRFAHSAVYDAAAQRMIVYGGSIDWGFGLDDVWSLDLSGGWEQARWTRLAPAGPKPVGRFDHAAVYLPDPGWMLVYGGSDGISELSELLALDLGAEPPRWLELRAGANRPSVLRGLAATTMEGQAIFQGGWGEGAAESLTWRLRCPAGPAPTWTALPPTATPAPPNPDPSTPGLLLPYLER
jgi:hypothetical protein